MKAKLLSTIFACLLCLTSSDKEGYFTISTSDKSWEFILNKSNNAQKLADKLKEKGSMKLIFIYYDFEGRANYEYKSDPSFGFEKDQTQNKVKAYDMYAKLDGNEYIRIILKEFEQPWTGTKIGNLKGGVNTLDEFDSSLCTNAGGYCKVTFTLAYVVEPETDTAEPETDTVEPETDIVEPKVAEKSEFPFLIVLSVVYTALGAIVLCVLIKII